MNDRSVSGHGGQPLVTVVIPAYNEERNVRAVYDAILAALGAAETLEIIFVDDGSTDGTAARRPPPAGQRSFGAAGAFQPELRTPGRAAGGPSTGARRGCNYARLRSAASARAAAAHGRGMARRGQGRADDSDPNGRFGILQIDQLATFLSVPEPPERDSGYERRRRLSSFWTATL